MSPRVECHECGGVVGDVPPCGCDSYERARIRDQERFELRERRISYASQALLADDVSAERALRSVIESTREEREDALRFGPQTRRTMAMHIVMKRCEALSKREATVEWRDAPMTESVND